MMLKNNILILKVLEKLLKKLKIINTKVQLISISSTTVLSICSEGRLSVCFAVDVQDSVLMLLA